MDQATWHTTEHNVVQTVEDEHVEEEPLAHVGAVHGSVHARHCQGASRRGGDRQRCAVQIVEERRRRLDTCDRAVETYGTIRRFALSHYECMDDDVSFARKG